MALWHDNPNCGVLYPGVASVNDFHGANGNGDKIAWQRLGLGKHNRLGACALRFLGEHRSIRKRAITSEDMESDLPRDLVAGLIKARKCSSGRYVFELRIDVPVVSFLYLKNPSHILAADPSFVIHTEFCRTQSNRPCKREAHQVFWFGNHLNRRRLSAGCESCILYGQLLGIEPEHRTGLLEIQINVNCPAECVLVRDDRQIHFVALRKYSWRQSKLGRPGCVIGRLGRHAGTQGADKQNPCEASARMHRLHWKRSPLTIGSFASGSLSHSVHRFGPEKVRGKYIPQDPTVPSGPWGGLRRSAERECIRNALLDCCGRAGISVYFGNTTSRTTPCAALSNIVRCFCINCPRVIRFEAMSIEHS